MPVYRVGDHPVIYSPSGPKIAVYPTAGGPTLTPVALDSKLVVTGHSIPDAIFKWPWSGVITQASLTPAIWSSTGPYATAQIRWNDNVAAPDAVRTLLQAGGADYDLFIGGEAHGPYEGKYTVNAHILFSDAYGYAVTWHNAAAAAGCQTWYFNFWRVDETAPSFGSVWRSDQNAELVYWNNLIDHVNANRAGGTPAMRLLPFLQVFMAVYDAIQAGTVTGITMADLFSDEVHPSDLGRWIMMATVLLAVYQRHPDELSNSVPLQYTGFLTISSGLAAQLRPIIYAACIATPRTGLVV